MTTMSQQPKAPQPAIIAPSREDILSNLAFFFGDPASPEKLRDYSEHQAATYHFPGTRLNSNPCRLSCVFLTLPSFPFRRVLRPEQPHPRHPEQSDLEGVRQNPRRL